MTPEEIAAMKAENEALKAANEKLKTPPKPADPPPAPPKPEDEGDLRDKAKRDKEALDAKTSETKQIEAAVTFNVELPHFLKENADVLPASFAELVKQADKETYDSKIERMNVIKAAFIQEFFAVQENVDALTKAQKAQLDEFLKLTKTAKEQKSDSFYVNVFEPALEMQKKLKKAEELTKARLGLVHGGGGTQDANIKKISRLSEEFYLGKKEAA